MELDDMDAEKIREQEWKGTHREEIQAQMRLWEALIQTEDVGIPSWWVDPATIPDFPPECETVRDLLNDDDFQRQLQAMAGKTIADNSDEEYVVQRAGVALVGPAGLVIRAWVKQVALFAFEDEDGLILEVPYPFDKPTTSVFDLRGIMAKLVKEYEE
jgi:hypothetical protein